MRSQPAHLDHDGIETPMPVGLLVLGLTMLLFNLNGAGVFPLSALILGMGILYGGVALVLVGLVEWRHGNAFGSAAFTALGLFWLSLIAMIILPRTGFGQVPQANVMVAYLAMWGVFTCLLFLVTLRLSRALQAVFGALFVGLLLQTIGYGGGGQTFHLLAAWIGICGGLIAIYAAAALGFNQASGRSVVPLGQGRQA